MAQFSRFSFPLFVPGTRPDRFAKARAAGADLVIVDLEDAVAESEKDAARDAVAAALSESGDGAPVFVRINGADTEWHPRDLSAVSGLPIDGLVLPKAEDGAGLDRVRTALGDEMKLIALVESATGIANVREVARHCDRIAFGSIDFAADVGCAHERDALLFARSEVVLAARLSGQPAPVDGVTTAVSDAALIEADAAYGAMLGFAGKLLIHPAQLAPAKRGYAPAPDRVDWAKRIIAASVDGAARSVDGQMVDAPVLAQARDILGRLEALT
ncbi:CoA ester lyase [Amorphus sp. 3PC139-8]|uniref:HpcH/HpaI aldolase/citrate lyase family protein n=1 Tax=Amorphus sp. 3PC139-8 TaxID=2735676 RepID=UPI00345DAF2E